jgi:NitT/TauT family transport system ATP-binding protein
MNTTPKRGRWLIQADNITLAFPSPTGPFCVLDNVSLKVEAGEFLCIVGPSGCGKTSLLRVLGGLTAPSAGSIFVGGEPLTSPRRDIGFVFQRVNLMPWRTVLRNVTLPLEIEGVKLTDAAPRAERLLDLVGLAGYEESYPKDLSGGMQQRVIIARALVHDPIALLMDEPFGSLDALTRERMNLELLRIWTTQRKTIILVTHSIQEAIFLADRVVVMNSQPGRIVQQIPVPLPRPRTLAMQFEDTFGPLVERIRMAIGCSPESQCAAT